MVLGFPRDVAQAMCFDDELGSRCIQAVLFLDCPGPQMASRVIARQPQAKRTIRPTFAMFTQQTIGVLEHYAKMSISVFRIDASLTTSDTAEQISELIARDFKAAARLPSAEELAAEARH